MKKIVKTIGLACLAGLFAVSVSSCKKSQDNTTSVVLTMEEIEDVYPGNERAYINMLDHGRSYWNRNDRIRAYNLDVTNNPNAYLNSTTAIYECGNAAEDQAYATFYGPNLGAMQSDDYRFFYPVGMVNGVLGPYNTDTFTVAPVQHYTDKLDQARNRHYITVDPLAMPLASKHTSLNNFEMHHAFGYLKLVISGEGWVERVVLTDPNHHLTGQAVLNVGKADLDILKNMILNFKNGGHDSEVQQTLVDYVYNPAELGLQTYPDGNIITLDCSDNPVELSTVEGKHFIFAVRPAALWWDPQSGQEPWYVTIYFDQSLDSGRAPIVVSAATLLNAIGGDVTNPISCRQFTSRPGKCNQITYQLFQ